MKSVPRSGGIHDYGHFVVALRAIVAVVPLGVLVVLFGTSIVQVGATVVVVSRRFCTVLLVQTLTFTPLIWNSKPHVYFNVAFLCRHMKCEDIR